MTVAAFAGTRTPAGRTLASAATRGRLDLPERCRATIIAFRGIGFQPVARKDRLEACPTFHAPVVYCRAELKVREAPIKPHLSNRETFGRRRCGVGPETRAQRGRETHAQRRATHNGDPRTTGAGPGRRAGRVPNLLQRIKSWRGLLRQRPVRRSTAPRAGRVSFARRSPPRLPQLPPWPRRSP